MVGNAVFTDQTSNQQFVDLILVVFHAQFSTKKCHSNTL